MEGRRWSVWIVEGEKMECVDSGGGEDGVCG